MNVITLGEQSTVVFVLVNSDGAPVTIDPNQIRVRCSVGGKDFDHISPEIKSLGNGYYSTVISADPEWPNPLTLDITAPGAQVWRDIISMSVPAPVTPPPVLPPTNPSPPEESLGSEVLPSAWLFHDDKYSGRVISESANSIRVALPVAGNNQQAYKIISNVTNGEYVIKGALESVYNNPAVLHVHEHDSPWRSVIGDPLLVNKSFNKRISISAPNPAASLRVRFQFDGQFSGDEQYSISGLSLRKVTQIISVDGGSFNDD